MARELETTSHQTIRNNLIIILCDLTVRYSAKVDPYIDTISACLKDPSLVSEERVKIEYTHKWYVFYKMNYFSSCL